MRPHGDPMAFTDSAQLGTLEVNSIDDGKGMSPEQLTSLFDFHFSRRTRVHMGMGLKVAYAIVQKHRGTLTASNTGRGTLMTINLPVEMAT